ncbi:hypothetical protein MF406_12075 [Georgenia sp. TF02-10]|uniref:hypothetical protein n=1 Tax=Georgenia sp. TF02-10 TaxID=2917725 RepID=UPI001FA73846|nr:hypothetical protein [Georgenia sp. TF02-10]UNX53720.1 hypothetical protein MF406_12075 [Georgenia sp. TF02-10]
MTRKDSRLEKAASRIMDLDSPAYGDERERAVSMEARAYGITVGIYLSLVVALVSAILGQVLLAVVLLLTMSLPNWAAIWYARRHDVDIEELFTRVDVRSRVPHVAAVVGGFLLVLGAAAYTLATGHGLVPLEVHVDTSHGFGKGFVWGAVIGAIGGAAVAAVQLLRKTSRDAGPQAEAAD